MAGVCCNLVRDDMKSFDEARVMVKDLATGVAKELITGGMGPTVTTSGHLLFGRGGTLFAAPIDVKNWHADGTGGAGRQRPAHRTPRRLRPLRGIRQRHARLHPGPAQAGNQREVLVFDRRGEPVPSRIPTGAYNTLRMSPSRRRPGRVRLRPQHTDVVVPTFAGTPSSG